MAKFILVLLFALTTGSLLAKDSDNFKLDELRQKYLKASKDHVKAKEFHKQMSAYTGQEGLIKGYQAASEAVMAKYVWNPYGKLKHLKTSAALFEEAVSLDKKQPEIRFLRFTVEHYVPRYLNLSAHVEEDKKIILASLEAHPHSGLSEGLARTMRDFMLSKDHCTEAEKQMLRKVKI